MLQVEPSHYEDFLTAAPPQKSAEKAESPERSRHISRSSHKSLRKSQNYFQDEEAEIGQSYGYNNVADSQLPRIHRIEVESSDDDLR